MLTRKRVFTSLLALAFAFASTSTGQVEIVEGEYLLLMNAKDSVPTNLDEIVSGAGGTVLNKISEIGIAVAASDNEDFTENLEKDKAILNVIPRLDVQWIRNDTETYPCSIGDDEPLFGYQWNMRAIDAPGAWDEGYTGAGVRVAVLDTGIDYTHPELSGNYWGGRNFVGENLITGDPDDPFDDDWHGTHVSGIIAAADDGVGVIGVAPEADLVAVKVLRGFPHGWGYWDWILQGIVYAAKDEPEGAGADVINMSLRGYLNKSEARYAKYIPYYFTAHTRAVNFATRQGVVVVSAAGNDSWDLDHDRDLVVMPAETGTGMAVSATGPVGGENVDNPASYTNYGQSAIDVAAPGGDSQLYPDPGWELDMILSCDATWWTPHPSMAYFWSSGTSMAAPHVCGVAALVIEANGGEMHPAQVKAIIEQSADDLGKPGMDDYYGRGRINAYKAVTHR
jgi:subtilisin family serine protease